MDLSSLQNNLPRGKPSPPPPSIPPATLTTDFKAAALAVTKLYQNSARQIDHARQEGYLSAVQEVAALLSQGEIAGDRLREWCAVGLSRITAQQDEENRSRPNTQTASVDATLLGEAEYLQRSRLEAERDVELTPPASSPPVMNANRMQIPLQNPFADTEFTFHSPSPGMGLSGYASPFLSGGTGRDVVEEDVTYEVIENQREGGGSGGGGGRKRGVNHQLGSIWDIGGGKRSRHM